MAKTCRSARAVSSDSPGARHQLLPTSTPQEYRGDWDKFNLFRYRSTVNDTTVRAYSMPTIRKRRASSCSTCVSPRRRRTTDVPPGIMSSYIWSLKAGDKVTISAVRRVLLPDTDAEMILSAAARAGADALASSISSSA